MPQRSSASRGSLAVRALVAVVAVPLGWGIVTLCTSAEPVHVGRYTVYGPHWDRFDGASFPADYKRWRMGPFFVIHPPR